MKPNEYDAKPLFQALQGAANELANLKHHHERQGHHDLKEYDELRLVHGNAVAECIINERHLTSNLYDRLAGVLASMRDLINYQQNCDYAHSGCGAFQNMAGIEVTVGRIHALRELRRELMRGGGANCPAKP